MILFAIAEDEEAYCAKIKKELSSFREHELTICVKDGHALLLALNKAKRLPDILLLDIQMPKIDGLVLTQYITLKYPSIKIIGVSTHSNKELVTEVLSEGAIGFITKYFTAKESLIYSQIYGCWNIFFEAIEAALINQLYLDALLFNNTENLVLSKSTKKIINQNFSSLTTTCIEFLILNAAELSFAGIAAIMQKSKDSIKYYYNTASFEFCVKGREQLMKYCLKNGLIKLPVYYDKTAQ